MRQARGITIHREVLLIEIERRCSSPDCNERVFVGLTKLEALDYCGFECSSCERWSSDTLTKTDTPEWWDDIKSKQQTTRDFS
jgi:hypothetical protein